MIYLIFNSLQYTIIELLISMLICEHSAVIYRLFVYLFSLFIFYAIFD